MERTVHVCCPGCGSSNVRLARRQNAIEFVEEWVGVYALRCRDCSLRFQKRVWSLQSLMWAKCPRCYRTELTYWSEQYYRAGAWSRFLLGIGANPARCDFCRCNFVSFRPVKKTRSRPPKASAMEDR